jgi:hypothetical protein
MRILSLGLVFVAYTLVLLYKMKRLLAEKDRLESALKSERIHCAWLTQQHPPAQQHHERRPPGPREEEDQP